MEPDRSGELVDINDGLFFSGRLLLRPFPYQWDMFAEPEALRLELRGPTRALTLIGFSIGLAIFGFLLHWYAGMPLGNPAVVTFFVVGAVGFVLSVIRNSISRRIVLLPKEGVAKLSGAGWFATGRTQYLLDKIWLEVRPIIVSSRHAFGRDREGFILFIRTPNDTLALCMNRGMPAVQAYLERMLAIVQIRVEVVDDRVFARDI